MPKIPTKPRAPRIAAIIPACNEAENIGRVLAVLRKVDILNEIIVVDDGSDDTTAEIVHAFIEQYCRVRLIQHEVNKGKGQAIFSAWSDTQAGYLILLDADLVNLNPSHIEALLEALLAPILAGAADMTLGLFLGGRFYTDFAHWAIPWLTGQRGLRAEILNQVSRDAAAGYGFEVALTVAAQRNGYRTRIVPLKGVWHPPSEFRRGWRHGIRWRLRMYGNLLRAWYIATGHPYPKMNWVRFK
ncbi:MAG: glycosyltransferase family 2 protein [Anaerolineales bacterium]|nr:glycosyltransferase family 2 protein [Anaerolineales bacterium]